MAGGDVLTTENPVTPFVQDPDFTLWHGDVREVLRDMDTESVDCVVTSPPYWGLRDYGVDGQIGLERTPQEYVATLIDVFREVRRVLAPHGTVFLNLGDSYFGDSPPRRSSAEGFSETWDPAVTASRGGLRRSAASVDGLKPKDRCMIPARVAIGLCDDGWHLRQEIVWAKGLSFCESYSGSVMPESVADRPTTSHEMVYLLAKSPSYYFDAEAVREKAKWERWGDQTNSKYEGTASAAGWVGSKSKNELQRNATWEERKAAGASRGNVAFGENVGAGTQRGVHGEGLSHDLGDGRGRNVRSVWAINPEPYPDAHFATFPTALVRPMILAGCAERVCRTCGKPSERITERGVSPTARPRLRDEPKADNGFLPPQHGYRGVSLIMQLGWTDCGHDDYRTGRVLDPFMGSGTVALVARQLGRHAVGVELNEKYAAQAAKRLQQQSLFAETEVATAAASKPAKRPSGMLRDDEPLPY